MINEKLGYDEYDPISIESYGQLLIGKTFSDICKEDDAAANSLFEETTTYAAKHEDKKRKGGLGEIIEERHFHYRANSDSNPDFDKAGVELKVTPYKKNKNGSLSAKERLVLTMIDYVKVVDEPFYDSHFWNKSQLILLVYYFFDEGIKNRLDYRIDHVRLFTPPAQDIPTIIHDYESIVQKIRDGKAHELSESDTVYLGACTKSATSKNRRRQPFSDVPAKPRAFAFKTSYMTYVLNTFIIPEKSTYEQILPEGIDVPLETYVSEKIATYKGCTAEQLCSEFGIDARKKQKNLESRLVYEILGIKGNQAEEFAKANIVVKTMRVEADGSIEQHMSFPAFKFKELIEEEWEDSRFGNYLRETKFFFVVYQRDDDGTLRLKGCKFWNIPYDDLEGHVHKVWERTKDVIKDGLEIVVKNGKQYTNLPKSSEDTVCHVRPHGRDAADTYELPDGRKFTKQCFWLDRRYIREQIKDLL